MRIVLFSHYFPPEVNAPANRSSTHARHWAARGHDVTVITCTPNHPKGEIFEGFENLWFQRSTDGKITVIRVWTYITPNAGFVRRTVNYLVFAVLSVLASTRIARPDVIVATSPQFFCALAGWFASRLRRTRFVAEIRDLWPDSIVALDQLKSSFVIRCLEWLERRLYLGADGIIALTHSFVDHIVSKGVQRDRIRFVPNGIDLDQLGDVEPVSSLRQKTALFDKRLVAYVGTVGLAHGLGTLLSVAERTRGNDGLHYLIVGEGAEREKLERETRERGLTNLSFLGLVPRQELLGWLEEIDVSVVLLRDLPLFQTVIPSKIFELLASRVPMILAGRGESRKLVSDNHAGIVVDPEDPEALQEAIEATLKDREQTEVRRENGRRLVEKEFDRGELALRMLHFLEEIAAR